MLHRFSTDPGLGGVRRAWSALLTRERERVLSLLVEKIDFNGSTRELKIAWRLAGFGQLADEVSS